MDRSLQTFVAEAEDILETANRALLSLEEARETGRRDPDILNSLFRAIHSFKGLAGMFGLKAPSDLTHKLEFLLDGLRLGKIDLTRQITDLLVETVALAGKLVRQAAGNKTLDDISEAASRIDRALQGKQAEQAGDEALDGLALDPEIVKVLTEYEEYRLKENIRERNRIHIVKVRYDLSEFEAGIKALNELLKEHGEVICTLPTAGGEAGGIGFSLVVGVGGDKPPLADAPLPPHATIEEAPYQRDRGAEEQKDDARRDAVMLKSVSNTVRVDIFRLDNLMNTVGEMHLTKNVINRIVKDLQQVSGASGFTRELQKAQKSLERKLNELQEGILEVRMVPIGQIFTRLAQAVRTYANEEGKDVELRLQGEETELDKLMIEDLADPLMHLVRNAIDHGIEPQEARRRLGKPEKGSISLQAFPRGNHVVITIRDDGAGMSVEKILAKAIEKGLLRKDHGLDPALDRKDILDLIFLPGFTTRDKVTEISGRGVGMDVVRRNISRLSGMIDIDTEPGAGTTFTLTLPITLAIIKALIVETGERVFAIPLNAVLEIIQATPAEIDTVELREVMAVRDETIPLLRLAQAFNLPAELDRPSFYVILVGLAERRLGIIVDGLKDQQEIVIKPLGKRLAEVPGIAGATELGDKRGVVLVLDVESLIEGAFRKAVAARQG